MIRNKDDFKTEYKRSLFSLDWWNAKLRKEQAQ